MSHNPASSTDREPRRLNVPMVVLYCLAVSLVFGLLCGYTYGFGDHVEELPLVKRAIDPSYCPRDFFINRSQQFNPASYFVGPLAALARFLPLPGIMFVLMILINWASLVVTYLAARDLFDASDLTCMIACAIMAAVRGVRPGGSAELVFREAIPPAAAGPFLLVVLWMSLRQRYFAAAVAAIPAIVIHPTLGLVTPCVGIGGSMLATVWELRETERGQVARDLARGAVALALLVGFGWVMWMRQWESVLSTAEFYDITARFRTPHHRVPSTFPPLLMLDTVAFIVATVVGLRWTARRDHDLSAVVRRMGTMTFLTIGLLVCGYLFVEVWPIRSVIALAAFRFLFVPKWIALFVFAALITHQWRARDTGSDMGATVLLASNGTLYGMSTLLGEAIIVAHRQCRRWLDGRHIRMLSSIGALIAAGMWIWQGHPREIALLILVSSMSLCLLAVTRNLTRALIAVAVPLLLAGLVLLNARSPLPIVGDELQKATPEFTLSQSAAKLLGVSQFVRGRTANDAIFVAPPDFATFRLTAERALVVDFKCVPFGDRALLEWYERLESCYGPLEGGGFPARRRMQRLWAQVSDTRLLRIARMWDADYAILYATTPTSLDRVYEDRFYTVVDLRGEADQRSAFRATATSEAPIGNEM
ncbi:MAG: hypothetical protein GF393_02340 [Armatimonadia bacterium]|nr:hypothetical protein [Armatimonadia bacterium]